MKFLNGWKTITGLVGMVGTVVVSAGGKPAALATTILETAGHLDSVILGVFGALTAVGLIHKAEKRSTIPL